MTEHSLRTAGDCGPPVPGCCLVKIAHVLRTMGQDERKRSLRHRRATCRSHPCPQRGRYVIWIGGFACSEETGRPRMKTLILRTANSMKIEHGQQRLRFEVLMMPGPFKPYHCLGRTERHASTLKIAATDAVFRLREARTRGVSIKPERPSRLAGRK